MELTDIIKIDDLLQECIEYLSRKRNLSDPKEQEKDFKFVKERFGDIPKKLLDYWIPIIIVNRAHQEDERGLSDDLIKHLLICSVKRILGKR